MIMESIFLASTLEIWLENELSHRVVLIVKRLCLVRPERKSQILYIFSYIWNPQNKANKWI